MPRCVHLYCASGNAFVTFPKSTQDIQRWMTLTERDSDPMFYLKQAQLKPGVEEELLECGHPSEEYAGDTSQKMWFRG
jgi:hypothetical protein